MFLNLSIELLQSGYSVRFRPGGHSMSPTIRDGEPVIVAPVKPSDVKRGDIILYKAERGPIAHRVITIRRGRENTMRFIVRGDASTSFDNPVCAEQVLGKVISVERKGTQHKLTGVNSSLRQMVRLSASQLNRHLPARVRVMVRSFRETLGRRY